MKKLLSLILTLALIMCAFASCSLFGGVEEEGAVTVVIETEDGKYDVYKANLEEVENKSEGAVGVIEALRDRKDKPLSVNMTDSAYGKYIKGIGGLEEDALSKKYVMTYTSLEKDFGTWDGVGTLEYGGVTLKSCAVGVSAMTVEAGMIILFRLEASQW
jgi:hypothetical protein